MKSVTVREKNMAQSSNSNAAPAALAFLAGIGAGIAAGILFAPRSGEETRYRLKNKAEQARSKVEHKIAEEKHLASDKIKEVKDKAKHIAEEGRHTVQEKTS
jgi:gas vesicle protein